MNRFTPIAFLAAAILVPSMALAASIQLSPSTVSVTTGHTFTVQVIATPGSSPLYTVSAHVSFTPGVIAASSFSFGSTWMQVSQSGYDSIDNTGGTLVKTGGFPAGFASPTTIGTITFTAENPGSATISVSGNSILLDQNSANEVSGTQGSVAVTVTNPPATPATTQTTTQTTTAAGNTTPTTGTTTASGNGTTNAGQTASAASAIGTSSQTAAIGSIFNSGVPAWLWWLLLAILVIGGGYAVWRRYFSTNA